MQLGFCAVGGEGVAHHCGGGGLEAARPLRLSFRLSERQRHPGAAPTVTCEGPTLTARLPTSSDALLHSSLHPPHDDDYSVLTRPILAKL